MIHPNQHFSVGSMQSDPFLNDISLNSHPFVCLYFTFLFVLNNLCFSCFFSFSFFFFHSHAACTRVFLSSSSSCCTLIKKCLFTNYTFTTRYYFRVDVVPCLIGLIFAHAHNNYTYNNNFIVFFVLPKHRSLFVQIFTVSCMCVFARVWYLPFAIIFLPPFCICRLLKIHPTGLKKT